MFVAYCFETVYPALHGHVMGRPWSNGCIWQKLTADAPNQDELTRYFVDLQHAGFDRIVASTPGSYWVAYRSESVNDGRLVVRHTVRVWSSVTDTRVLPLIAASGSPVPRPQWYE